MQITCIIKKTNTRTKNKTKKQTTTKNRKLNVNNYVGMQEALISIW